MTHDITLQTKVIVDGEVTVTLEAFFEANSEGIEAWEQLIIASALQNEGRYLGDAGNGDYWTVAVAA